MCWTDRPRGRLAVGGRPGARSGEEPKEITQSRQQQEILRDLLQDLGSINATVKRIARDEGGLDLDKLERRIREVVED